MHDPLQMDVPLDQVQVRLLVLRVPQPVSERSAAHPQLGLEVGFGVHFSPKCDLSSDDSSCDPGERHLVNVVPSRELAPAGSANQVA